MRVKISWRKVSTLMIGLSISLFTLGLGKILFSEDSPMAALAIVYIGGCLGVLAVLDKREEDDPNSG